jgi:uncharacterized protein YicC (UPF0701 family)
MKANTAEWRRDRAETVLSEYNKLTAKELFEKHKIVRYERSDINEINTHIKKIRDILNKYDNKFK